MPFRNTTVRDRVRAQIAKARPACHICGKPIDYSLVSPDPFSFEVDHVIASSRGGSDEAINCKPSHRACNRAKSNREHAPIIKRSRTLQL